jgi:hypothetical protein
VKSSIAKFIVPLSGVGGGGGRGRASKRGACVGVHSDGLGAGQTVVVAHAGDSGARDDDGPGAGETAATVRNENEWGVLLCYFQRLCRVPAIWHSTKYTLPSVGSSSTRQRLFYFFINSLASVPPPPSWHSTKNVVLSVFPQHSTKNICIFFFNPPNFLWFVTTLYALTCSILIQLSKCLLLLFDLVSIIGFLWMIQIWTASDSKHGKSWM